jgi:hypothetical protein
MKGSELLLCCLLLAGCGSGSRTEDAEVDTTSTPPAAILVKHCSTCHAPPSPRLHTKEEWPNVVARMEMHRLDARMPALTKSEQDDVLSYLQAHAK